MINGHECKVFSASNVELITKTRLEHLSEADKARARAPRTPLQSFLGIAEQQQESCSATTTSVIFIPIIIYFSSVIVYSKYANQIIYFRKNLTM